MPHKISIFAGLTLILLCTSACSIKRFAVNKVGDALASGGSVYESDEDMILVGDALPFSLKLVESLLAESPKHRGLLLTACRGFTLYSYGYVHAEVDLVIQEDFQRGRALRTRARKLYLRAHRYCLRALEKPYPGITEKLLTEPRAAAGLVRKPKDVEYVYWTAAALGLAISVSKGDAKMLARLPEVEAQLDRALELNESWGDGSLQEFQIVFAAAKPGEPDKAKIRRHYERALELAQGRRAGVYLAYAEAVSVAEQNRSEFTDLLNKALAIDPDAHEEVRLANLFSQRRARWLLENIDDYFLE